ncbi:hypothetical protein GQ44DRAFT_796778 [Phaeosphaeriaceae sp. PMI808]|nr:hypothetical protein GQ44DRAFT_796778 [Phaeosphaeriaceae sp. PMI808]
MHPTRRAKAQPRKISKPDSATFLKGVAKLDSINAAAIRQPSASIIDSLSDNNADNKRFRKEDNDKGCPELSSPQSSFVKRRRNVIPPTSDSSVSPSGAYRLSQNPHTEIPKTQYQNQSIAYARIALGSIAGQQKRPSDQNSPYTRLQTHTATKVNNRTSLGIGGDRHGVASAWTNNTIQMQRAPTPNAINTQRQTYPSIYSKHYDSTYDPVRDPDHEVHKDCNNALPSIEDRY